MGDSREREFVNTLEATGWGAVRIGGSGSGTDRNLPDIIAGNGGWVYWGVEEKYRGKRKQCYIESEKATALIEFCTRFGLRPLAAVRYSTRLDGVQTADWFLAPLETLPQTDSGRLKAHHSVAQHWPTLTEVLAAAELS